MISVSKRYKLKDVAREESSCKAVLSIVPAVETSIAQFEEESVKKTNFVLSRSQRTDHTLQYAD